MQDYRRLRVWRRAHRLTLAVYGVTNGFPKEERYGLSSQMRRASASIPSNIAEACGRATRPDMARLLTIATGSASELQYQVHLAKDLGYLDPDRARALQREIAEIRRMLTALTHTVRLHDNQNR